MEPSKGKLPGDLHATVRVLLFSDVENSTQMAQRVGALRAAALWAAHDRQARDLLTRHDGREMGRSDGMFLMFDDPVRAARYALDYQSFLHELGLAPRVGLHLGPVTLRSNTAADVDRGAARQEVVGVALSIAARLMALARGGQTLVCAGMRAELEGSLPEGAAIVRHGHYRVKGIDEPLEVHELGVRGQSKFHPPSDVPKAYRVVREGELWVPVSDVRHNLPAERDAFVGRDVELRRLATDLEDGARLVTLQGPGGIGKTRVVRRYAWSWLGDWPGGVYFCDLSEARSREGLLATVARALAVPLNRTEPAEQLEHAIAGRGRCLVILDNFEQLVGQGSATVGAWLDRAPDARFIVTSREVLHIPGEKVVPLDALPVDGAAVDLFVARARAQHSGFALDDANRAAVLEVVRLLDGLPLAIELAAARIRLLAPTELLARLQQRFTLLAGMHGAPARQATMRAAIDWSWNLLTPWEQAALAQCSVFDGNFAVEAAEAVLQLDAWPEAPPAIDVVQALCDKSLLRTTSSSESGSSLHALMLGMYISIREYAADRLAAQGLDAQRTIEQRHGAHYAAFGTEDAIAALSRRDGIARIRALSINRDNVLTACRRAARNGNASVAVATYAAAWELLERQGPASEGITLGERVVSLGSLTPAERARALTVYGTALRRVGRVGDAMQALEQARDLAGNLAVGRTAARTLLVLGGVLLDQRRFDEARTHIDAVQAIATECRDVGLEGSSRNLRGILDAEAGRFDAARESFEAALALQREAGDARGEGATTANLANIFRLQGNVRAAIEHFERALAIQAEIGDQRVAGLATGNLGLLYCESGRHEDAIACCERAMIIHREVGNRHAEGIVLGTLGKAMTGQGRLAEARDHLRCGERLLRELADHEGLAIVICDRASAEIAANDPAAARIALAEAESVVTGLTAGWSSEAGRRCLDLRAQLAGDAASTVRG